MELRGQLRSQMEFGNEEDERPKDMELTPEIEARGLKAYEQALAFERLRTWRLPLGHAIFVMIPLGCGLLAMKTGYGKLGVAQFFAAGLFAMVVALHWRRLRAAYAKNLEMVAEMEREYGEQLSWVQVNKHFAELERLQREMAE